jgi:D-alanyl-D-alanine dipeptidase
MARHRRHRRRRPVRRLARTRRSARIIADKGRTDQVATPQSREVVEWDRIHRAAGLFDPEQERREATDMATLDVLIVDKDNADDAAFRALLDEAGWGDRDGR